MAARPLPLSQRHQVALFGCCKTLNGPDTGQLDLVQGTLVPGPLALLACQNGGQLGVQVESCPRVISLNHLRRNSYEGHGLSQVLTECLSLPSPVLPHGLGAGVTGAAASLVPGGRPQCGATDCHNGLVRALGVVDLLAPNVDASRLPVAGPGGLTGRERCSLKAGLAQALPVLIQNQGCLKE